MGKRSKILPEPLGEPYTDRASNALHAISFVLDEEFPAELRADEARRAAAEVRAWRKSLDGESCREDATGTGSVRSCLRWAAMCVLWADEDARVRGLMRTRMIRTREEYLRRAEAYLREAASLLDAEDPK